MRTEAEKLEWAVDVISRDVLGDGLGFAAHIVLTELLRLRRGEFICSKCSLRKDGESVSQDF